MGGLNSRLGGVGGLFSDQFSNFQSKSKSASLSGSGKIIGFVHIHSSDLQSPILSL